MIDFKEIKSIFSNFLQEVVTPQESNDTLFELIKEDIKTNQVLWNLEDTARMSELGAQHVASTKKEIDKYNQIRNNLIREIDEEITKQMSVIPLKDQDKFYAESPGMIIDRLSILFIKSSVINQLMKLIEDDGLQNEYSEKESIVSKQINDIGAFLDLYFQKLKSKEIYFYVQQPVKIYNDQRIRKYIKHFKT